MYAAFKMWIHCSITVGDNQAKEPLMQITAQNDRVLEEIGMNKSLSQPTLVLLTKSPNFFKITNFIKAKNARLRPTHMPILPYIGRASAQPRRLAISSINCCNAPLPLRNCKHSAVSITQRCSASESLGRREECAECFLEQNTRDNARNCSNPQHCRHLPKCQCCSTASQSCCHGRENENHEYDKE